MPIEAIRRWFSQSPRQEEAPAAESGPEPGVLQPGLRIYAIGDIHGCLLELHALEEHIRHDLAARPVERAVIIHLGDYIDRGPQSRGVIDHFLDPPRDGLERRFVKGNHEETLLAALTDPAAIETWRRFGGIETMASYGVDVRDAMRGEGLAEASAELAANLPSRHGEFLRGLDVMIAVGGYCFVHAGVRPGVALRNQRQEDLLWIREAFLDHDEPFERVIVHGHTPVAEPERRANRINVDTGAYLTGKLSAAVLEQDTVYFLST